MEVVSLAIYPVKSCKGISVSQIEMDQLGPIYDRRLMIVDKNGKFLSQRALPKMALIKPILLPTGLRIEIPSQEPLEIKEPLQRANIPVSVWGDAVEGLDLGEVYAIALSQFLGVTCRLVAINQANPRNRKGTAMGFADSVPVLLTNQASLDKLNRQLTHPVGMERFRPNIIINGSQAFEEDGWSSIKIGSAHFVDIDPCTRCPIITIDQCTAQKQGAEPLKSLTQLRGAKPTFGARLRIGLPGAIRLGDKVELC